MVLKDVEGPSLLLQRGKKARLGSIPILCLHTHSGTWKQDRKETDALQGLEWDEQAQLKGVCFCFCFTHIILVRVILMVIPFVFESC